MIERKTILLSSLAVVGCTIAHSAEKGSERPNVLIIYTDDMGFGDLSLFNDGWVKTPNIDKLARQGVTLTQYYSAAPVSSASRVGLTTGQYPLQWGINTYLNHRKMNKNCEQFDYLDSSAPSMARAFKEDGYKTAHFGKWHMGGGRDVDDAPSITEYGFDEYKSTWESPDPDPLITSGNWIWRPEDEVKRWSRTEYFVDLTLDYFAKNRDGAPLFVNLWPDDMHTPWVDSAESQDRKETWESPENFDKVLEEYDKQIGRLVEGLERIGAMDDTIIVFTSDNGPSPSFESKRTVGRRGVKNSLYEGGILMPFTIVHRGVIPAGVVNNESIVTALDLFPSLCKMAGVELPKGYKPSGEDMSRALIGESQSRQKSMMWDFGRNKAFYHPKGNTSPHLAIRDGEWKLLLNSDGSRVELYNIATDHNETTNVVAENEKVVKRLSKELLAWWDTRRVRQ